MAHYKTYASEDYVKENSVSKNQGIYNIGKILGIDEQGKVVPLNYLSGVIFKDATTGINYIGCIDNGEWTLIRKIDGIEIAKLPDKTSYLKGEEIDLTGIKVIAKIGDESFELTEYTYGYDENVNDQINIYYIQNGIMYTCSFKFTLMSLDDFIYTNNDDGTITITDWKGTYNGEPSTKFIVPNSGNIIVNLD